MEYSQKDLLLLKALRDGGARFNLKYYFCVLSEWDKAPTFEEMRASFECLIGGGLVAFQDKRVTITRLGETVLRGMNREKILGDAEIPFTEQEFLEMKDEMKEIRRETHLTVAQLIRKFRPNPLKTFYAVALWLLSYAALAGAIVICCLDSIVWSDRGMYLLMGIAMYAFFGACSCRIAEVECSIKFERAIKVLTFPAWLLAKIMG